MIGIFRMREADSRGRREPETLARLQEKCRARTSAPEPPPSRSEPLAASRQDDLFAA